jgi:hypothetical protein
LVGPLDHGLNNLIEELKNSKTYFSRVVNILWRAFSQGIPGLSSNNDTSACSFIKSWYSNEASRKASALPSGQSKCFNTALSSTCIIKFSRVQTVYDPTASEWTTHIGSNDMMKGNKNMMKQPLLISSFGKEEEKSTER